MVANIIVGAILLAGITGAVSYILRRRKAAIKNHNPVCIGCPGACRCSGRCRSKKNAAY